MELWEDFKVPTSNPGYCHVITPTSSLKDLLGVRQPSERNTVLLQCPCRNEPTDRVTRNSVRIGRGD